MEEAIKPTQDLTVVDEDAEVETLPHSSFDSEANRLGQSFVGRLEEQQKVHDWLQSHLDKTDVAQVAFVGGGPGIGKSHLLAKVVADLLELGNTPYYHRFREGDARNSEKAFIENLYAYCHNRGLITEDAAETAGSMEVKDREDAIAVACKNLPPGARPSLSSSMGWMKCSHMMPS